ncbi:hypothetical protein OAS39_09065 [Pirellulales bacterium]|nr:hypothetical protein [Pirellulales bacterium]
MMIKGNEQRRSRLRILRTGDKQSRFNHQTPKEILEELGIPRYLLSSSAKAEKSAKVGVLNRVLYLVSGVTCAHASPGCLSTCLGFTSGRMGAPMATAARDRRTALYFEDQGHFLALLRQDLRELQAEAKAKGMVAAARLNGTSDIPFETLHPEIFREFEDTVFFDYTKVANRMYQHLRGELPKNYHLTFSVSERPESRLAADRVLQAGGNVAAVFWPRVPSTYGPYPVIDGDEHDARFLDPSPCIVGLSAKGIVAREELTGFVVRTDAA